MPGMSLSSRSGTALKLQVGVWAVLLDVLMSGCAAKKPIPTALPAQVPAPVTSNWARVTPPFKAANITSVGEVFWVCGENEMIASSSDGGNSWNLQHQNPSGATLREIGFVTEKVGYAAGTKGRLLSTKNGGKTWTAHNAADTIWAFSFSDASNGIAVIGGDSNRDPRLWGQPATMDGSVKLTHDGGDHWENIAALGSEELSPFTQVLTVAALDAPNYLMIRRQPGVEDVFLVTHDAGKSWHVVHQRNDATNRVLARWVFVHGGEYWAFGMELVHRDVRGGYGVPLTLRSKDGETWMRGTIGPEEFGGCNRQGCYMWDGTVESLYGEHEQYWALPQDGTLSQLWALTQDRACTVGEFVECGPATRTEQPQARPTRPAGRPQPIQTANMTPPAPAFRAGLPEGCIRCILDPIPWNIQQRSALWVIARLHIGPAGDVKAVALSQQLEILEHPLTEQLSQWRFQPSSDGIEVIRNVRLAVRCGFDNPMCEIVPTIAAP